LQQLIQIHKTNQTEQNEVAELGKVDENESQIVVEEKEEAEEEVQMK